MRKTSMVVVAFVLALVGVASIGGGAAAQTTGSIELHKRICQVGVTGNIFEECHDNVPEQTVSFSLDGGTSQSVDASGNVIFTDLSAGTYAVAETEGPPLDFVTLRVYCSVEGDGGEAVEVATDGPNFSVDLGEGEAVVCDVYNMAEDASGLEPTTEPEATEPGQVTLPNTGIGTGGPGESGTAMAGLAALLMAMAGGLLALSRWLSSLGTSGIRR